jgi:hypothetical protein
MALPNHRLPINLECGDLSLQLDISLARSTSREAVTACSPRREPGVRDIIETKPRMWRQTFRFLPPHSWLSIFIASDTPGLRLGLHAAVASRLVDLARDMSNCKGESPHSKVKNIRNDKIKIKIEIEIKKVYFKSASMVTRVRVQDGATDRH